MLKLFEPITIGGVNFKNRLYMPAMVTVGLHGPKALAFYAERARGGVGAITTQYVYDLSLILEKVNELKPLVDTVHQAAPDCKIAVQPGAVIQEKFILPAGYTSPSGPYSRATHLAMTEGIFELPFQPRAMTKEEIRWNIDHLAEAAANLKRIGFDYIEIHGTHGYLLRQFFSPLDNQRTDEYGGSLSNRMRFPLEVVQAIRDAVGNGFPIFYKMPALETEPGGITLDESIQFAIALEKAGVDALVVTVGVDSHPRGYRNTVVPLFLDFPFGTFVSYAAEIKKRVNIPVIALGRINNPYFAESILEEGKADMIGIGRQLIADPFWPEKVYQGQLGSIRPCLSCNSCLDQHFVGNDIYALRCAVNASAALEEETRILPSSHKKKVLVIGGGPGGMEAARVASIRGHKVTLCEKTESLGGMLLPASAPPNKGHFKDLVRYFATELRRNGVQILLNTEVTPEFIKKFEPEVLVVATGATPIPFPSNQIIGNNEVVSAVDVLMGRREVKEKVVIIGGGMVGCETALFLKEKKKIVSIIEMLEGLGMDILPTTRFAIIQKIKESGIPVYLKAKAQRILPDGVEINRQGELEVIKSESVVIAIGMEATRKKMEGFQKLAKEVYWVGDCLSSRKIRDAIHEGAKIGREI
ncbi:MAG: FAD-dependent oxidoreductase [Candidatus Anstonellales archaeon]